MTVDVQGLRPVGLDVAEKVEELLVPVAFFALSHDLSGGEVEGGEQGGGAVTDVIVGDAFDIAQTHGQQLLGERFRTWIWDFSINAEHFTPWSGGLR